MNIKSLFKRYRGLIMVLASGSIVLLAGLFVVLLRPSVPEAKATWLWDARLVESHTQDIIEFAKENGVTTVFLQIGNEVSDASYRRFVAAATKARLEVHALNGHPEWALREQRKEAVRFLDWVKQYNDQSRPEERFAGVQFDVEPYLLKSWGTKQDAMVEQWMESARIWVERAQRDQLKIGAAVPFWLNGIEHEELGKGRDLRQWMVDKFDYVAIMAYRDAAEAIYEVSRATLEEADERNKQVWVGVELTKSQEGPGVSFYEQPLESVTQELDKLVSLVGKHSSFKGVAVHSYESWRDKQETKVAQKTDGASADDASP
ncbi:hypothetical protein MKX50_15840 [Paenibacillus sp. FSL W8-0186]|uniref:Uncharacterized protein n=1 Tax=Paenibacillus woosongensis TaxID=307580 RepID=A0ABQ4MRI3_9BACL|nr:hypothetical protein [Paenibacillus woosongensis]GIP58015.1 hypothetical protein J15TS10_18290 [Paenibacillus woosongensis]